MTIGAKIIQVSIDLRKCGVINKGDKVFYHGDKFLSTLDEKYVIPFEIRWRTKKCGEEISQTVMNFISSQKEVYIRIPDAYRIICMIIPKKS